MDEEKYLELCIEEHFELWRKKEPWFYSRVIFNKTTYFLIMWGILSLVVSCSLIYPATVNLFAVLGGYFLAQFIFGWGHMTTHALYIESPPDKWEPGVLVAWLHHYAHPKVIYQYSLNHRLNFLMQTKGSFVAYGVAWALPFAFFGSGVFPLFFWYLFWFSMIEPVHEYYHVPPELRKRHFSFLVFHWLRLLEILGLINERKHREHHKHSAKNLGRVRNFTDLWFPLLDSFFDGVWSIALGIRDYRVFKRTPIRKALYFQGSILIPLTFVLCSYFFIRGEMF